jgi:hypothetical protein
LILILVWIGLGNHFRIIKLNGLGILHVEKFVAALRLRWLWLEWVDETREWIGLGNPSN